MSSSPGALGILAGGGPLPAQVARAAIDAGRQVYLLGFQGFAEPDVLAPFTHDYVRLGAAGKMLALLRAHDCRDLVLVGPVRRPSLASLRPDAVGVKIVARIGRAAFAGDDGMLAAVVRVLGEEGFNVIGAHEIMATMLGNPGVVSRTPPDHEAWQDIARGIAVVRALGAVDVGQGCIVQQGIVLAVEAIEGTDAMIARAAHLARPGPGGVLVKLVKPGQDRRADLPTIGPGTVANAHAAGLRGIAYEAGGTIFTDKPETIRAADKAGLFLIGIDPGDI
jgi:DUF1009 family protein